MGRIECEKAIIEKMREIMDSTMSTTRTATVCP